MWARGWVEASSIAGYTFEPFFQGTCIFFSISELSAGPDPACLMWGYSKKLSEGQRMGGQRGSVQGVSMSTGVRAMYRGQ